MEPIVLRFAPSPTGYLHVGGARTAIFNWLYARSIGGRFLLRIEDTDQARSSEAMTREILNGLRWLGVDWDEEPVLQSTRVHRHREECLRLLAENKAYWCWCTPEELEEKRRQGEREGFEYRYDGTCRHLSATDHAAREREGRPRTLRFKIPEGEVFFHDLVHEGTSFMNTELDDFIILRSDGTPVYMVAVVVDDHDMGVTHVLRGDDHLSNTPKQILLYQALGYEVPTFGHVPLILGSDKKRLSKRHGATSVGEYQMRGTLPEALFNFLALLGWSPGDDREIMTRDELVAAFDVRRILKKSSVFDEDKLRWLNGKHLRFIDDEDLVQRLRAYVPEDLAPIDDAYLRRVLPLMRERMFFLQDVFTEGSYFFRDPLTWDEAATAKLMTPETRAHLSSLLPVLLDTEWTATTLESTIREFAATRGLGAGKIIHPLRLVLTGGTNSPGLFEMMEALGKETVTRRLQRA